MFVTYAYDAFLIRPLAPRRLRRPVTFIILVSTFPHSLGVPVHMAESHLALSRSIFIPVL